MQPGRRVSGEDQRRDVARLLVRAFLDDPAYTWVFPRRDERRASLRAYWTAILQFVAVAGVVETTPDLSGVACWLPPMGRGQTLLAAARCGFAPTRATLGFDAASRKRLAAMVRREDEITTRLRLDRHWLLALLAVDPSRQSGGIGGGLLASGLAMSDARGLPSYLMTESERNVRFYGRHGFAVVDASAMDAGGPTIWIMVREVGAGPVRSGDRV